MAIYRLHLFDSLKEFYFILGVAHLKADGLNDFAYIFELIKQFLVMAAALHFSPRPYEGGQLVVEHHFPLYIFYVPHLFLRSHRSLMDVHENCIAKVLLDRPLSRVGYYLLDRWLRHFLVEKVIVYHCDFDYYKHDAIIQPLMN